MLRRKDVELVQIYEILNDVGAELFTTLRTSELKGDAYQELVAEQLENWRHLREYCNTQFAKISRTYSRTVPQIDGGWKMYRIKA